MRTLIFTTALFAASAALAQAPAPADLDYSYAELRFVDADNGGEGLSIGASYAVDANWIVVGSLSDLDFNGGVDSRSISLGAGYVWSYKPAMDLLAIARYIDTDVDFPGSSAGFPGGSAGDSGLGLSSGARGWIRPDIEWRGFVHHVDVGDSDTFIELAGDYYLNREISVGLSVEIGGDNDAFSIGGRWYFR
jgi:hypothetical protein